MTIPARPIAPALPNERATYQGARAAAVRVEEYFRRYHAAGLPGAGPVAPEPDAQSIETMIDAAFWASLRREEGYVAKISLAFAAPHHTGAPLLFERPLALEAAALARVAPAVERPGIHLGVWPRDGRLMVWGTIRSVPMYCFVLEVAAPGLLVIKHHRGGDGGKFANVAVLEGDTLKVIDEHATSLPDCPPLVHSLLGFSPAAPGQPSMNVLVQLAVSMRAHGRGGALLIVPAASDTWRESMVKPISYAVASFSELRALMTETPDDRRVWQDEVEHAVEAIAGLTAVDGATVLTERFELLAFGAKIGRRDGCPRVELVTVTEPIEGSAAQSLNPSELGGTRHLSAAQFVHDQHDAVALVASQDGHFTVFAWSPCENMVHAHRVEALLL